MIFFEPDTVKIFNREQELEEKVSIIKFVESILNLPGKEVPYLIPTSRKKLDYRINPAFKEHVRHHADLLSQIKFKADEKYRSEHSDAFYKAYSLIWQWLDIYPHFLRDPLNQQYFNLEGKVVAKAEIINSFYASLLREINDKGFKDKLKWREARARNQYRSAVKFVGKLLQHYSRVVVTRIDVSYHTKFLEEIDLNTIKIHFSRFLKGLFGRKEFRYVIGYIWKLEYGVEKGYHYHLIVFMDGSKVRNDAYYAELIGEYWSNNITGGRGYFYNCNRSKHKYKFLGIGMLSHDDTEMIDNLLICIRYLTKTSQYVMETCLDGKRVRVFGRSELLPVNPLKTVSVGRPRGKPSALIIG